ncbi:SusC/RagA family TonB-linked outer membrane protein [Portibacter lacus]|uniref:SusC/RagA family TonB-linked outer membrane protein n=2 Tax=Portibacter lacus TaxID=1099794 RepID=A0AA37WE10_9BACT|nr:SusC/RagA family TonB-linked outer membrane protein [Portibacter lacus]
MLGFVFYSTFSFASDNTNSNANFEKVSLTQDLKKDFTVTGTVLDSENLPLIGATVLLKDTNNGTITDVDGNFSIEVPSEESVIVISYTGYVTKEITVGSNRSLTITLADDATLLDEVVVVGYGTAKKETLTGSVEQVKAKAFEDLAQGSPALALQGRTPGLVVSRGSSRPGSEDINFLIRGASSINGIDPLIVIDGIPAINARSFNDMNPNDIESISVLKGGSASVYGARAAGGVILVTTKKGRGDVKVELSSVFRMGTIGIRPPTPTMSEYGELYLHAADQDIAAGLPPRYFFWADRDNLVKIANGEEGYYDLPINGNIWLANGNRFDEMFGNSFSNQQNISVSGGNEYSNFRVSGGYDQNVGGLKVAKDAADRYNLALNYNTDITKRLHFNTNINYFQNTISGPQDGLARDAATYDAPLFPTYNDQGQYYSVFGGVEIKGARNAIAEVVDGGRLTNNIEQFRVSAMATYDITDKLSLVGSFARSKQNSEYERYQLDVPLYSWQGDYATTINGTTFIEEGSGSVSYNNYKTSLNYEDSFGKHNFSGLVALEAEKNVSGSLSARRNGFVDYGVYDLSLGATDQLVTTNSAGNAWGFYGYIGRLNYNYGGKYLLELQGRRDGSSRFAQGSKWSNYGSVSAGWVLSEEEFLSNLSFLSFLKLRGGYGELGSTSGIGNFGYLSTVQFGNTVFGETNAALQQTSRASSLFSNTTTWERIINKEIGIDFSLFNYSIFGSVDLYQKNNVGMLVRGITPDVLGTSTPFTNIGTLETQGWEVLLGFRKQIGDLNLSISANMSDTRNEITEYEGAQTIYENLNDAARGRNILGKPINSFYLWETDGYFDSQSEVDAYYESIEAGGILPAQSSNNAIRVGDVRVVDSNGDGILNNDDLTYHGDAAAHYVYGTNFELQFKNFDFSAFFQGVLNQNIYRTGYFAQPFQAEWQNQSSAWLGRTWTEENRDAEFPRLSTQRGISTWNYRSKDHILQNNRYLRLKNLIIGYNIKGIKLGGKAIDNLRVYFSGNDLFEFTKVKDGYDPESGASTNNNAYPFMRTYALGFKVSI